MSRGTLWIALVCSLVAAPALAKRESRRKDKAARPAARANIPAEVRDLGMRNLTDRETAARQAQAAADLAKQLADIDERANKRLGDARTRLTAAAGALENAQSLLVGDLEGSDAELTRLRARAEEAQAEVAIAGKLLAAVTQAAAGSPDAALAGAVELPTGASSGASAAALYLAGLVRMTRGEWQLASDALGDERVRKAYRESKSLGELARGMVGKDEWKDEGKARNRAIEKARAQLEKLPGVLEKLASKARKDTDKALAAVAKHEARKRARIEKGLDEARKQLARANQALVKAREDVPWDFAERNDQVATLKAEAEAAQKTKAGYDQLAAAIEAFGAGKFGEAARMAEMVAVSLEGDAALDARYLAALAFVRAGDHAGAATSLGDKLIQARYPAAPRLLALALAASGDKKGALAAFGKLELGDDDVEALAAYAALLVEAGDHKKAREVSARASKGNPTDRALLIAMARAAIAESKHAEAIDPLERAVTLDAKDKDTMWLLAVTYRKVGRDADAERVLRSFTGTATPAPAAGGGSYDADLGHPGHDLFVVPLYAITAELPADPQADGARLYLAAAALAAGQLDAAGALLAALENPPPDALYGRGVVALRRGRLADASELFAQAAAAAPAGDVGQLHALHAMGVVALRRGELPAADDAFGRAAKLAPKDAAPQIGLAAVLWRAGKHDAAAKKLDKLGKDAAFGAIARLDRAVALGDAGKAGEAEKLLGKAASALAAQPEAAMLAARLATARKDAKAASAELERATLLAPGYVDAWRALGTAAAEAGDPARAAAALVRVLDHDPSDLDTRELLAKALEAAGDTSGAARERATLALLRKNAKDQLRDDARDGAIGIGTFDNITKSSDYAWLAQGIPEALTTDLKHTGLRLVERAQVAKAVEERQLGELGLVDPSTAPRVGQMIGAQAMIVGSYQIQGDLLHIDARLVDVTGGNIIQVASAEGPLDTLFALERRLAMDLVGDYFSLDDAARKKIYQAPQASLAGLQQVAAARVLLFKGEQEAANDAFMKAMQEDPEFAKEVSRFQKEWSALSATVACLPLTNITGNKDQDWYARGIAEALTGDLKRIGILVVERLAIDKVMQEKKFTDLFNPDQATQAGTQLGASMVVVGSYQVMQSRLQIDVRIVEVETGQVVLAERIVGGEAELFELQSKLAEKITRILNRPVSAEALARLREGKPSIEDFKRQVKRSSEVAISDKKADKVEVSVLAVGTFDNTTGKAEDAAIAERLAASMAKGFERQKRVRLVDRQAVVDAVKAGQDPGAAGLAVGADALIMGSYQIMGERIRAEARVVSTTSGEVLVSVKTEGGRSELAKIEDDLGTALRAGLGIIDEPRKKKSKSALAGIHKKWWFWSGVGVVVVGGVVTAIALSGDEGLPPADTTITVP